MSKTSTSSSASGVSVGCLPGLSMRRIADLTPGSTKIDAKDAAVITSDENATALSMLTGFDLDLVGQVNQNRGQSCTQPPSRPQGRTPLLAGRTPSVEASRRLNHPCHAEEGRPGTGAGCTVLSHLARQLISLHAHRADVAVQVAP